MVWSRGIVLKRYQDINKNQNQKEKEKNNVMDVFWGYNKTFILVSIETENGHGQLLLQYPLRYKYNNVYSLYNIYIIYIILITSLYKIIKHVHTYTHTHTHIYSSYGIAPAGTKTASKDEDDSTEETVGKKQKQKYLKNTEKEKRKPSFYERESDIATYVLVKAQEMGRICFVPRGNEGLRTISEFVLKIQKPFLLVSRDDGTPNIRRRSSVSRV